MKKDVLAGFMHSSYNLEYLHNFDEIKINAKL